MQSAARSTQLTAAPAACAAGQRPRPAHYAVVPAHLARKPSTIRGDTAVVHGVKLNANTDDLFALLGDSPKAAAPAAPPAPPPPAPTPPPVSSSAPSPFSIPKPSPPPAPAAAPPAPAPVPTPTPAPTPPPPAPAAAVSAPEVSVPEAPPSSDDVMDILRQSLNAPVPMKKTPVPPAEPASAAKDAFKAAVEAPPPAPVPQPPAPVKEAITEAPKTFMEATKAATEAPKKIVEATKAVTEAPKAATEVPKTFMEATKAVTEPPKTVVEATKAIKEAPKSVMEATKAAVEAPSTPSPPVMAPEPAAAPAIPEEVMDGAKEAKEAAAAMASDAGEKVGAGINAVQDRVGSAAGAASKAAGDITGQAGEQIGKAADVVKGGIDSLTGGATGAASQLSADANSALEAVSAQTAQLQAAALESAAAAANSAFQALPEPVADTLKLAAPAVKQAGALVSDAGPAASVAGAALAVGVPAAAVYNAVYGGFSGSLSAKEALSIMQSEEALLVDIRTVPEREAGGIPKLKSSARRKAVAVPFASVSKGLKGRIEGAGVLAADITAVQIAGLAAINSKSTKVIIMDRNGSGAKSMARNLRTLGISQTYVLEGGFQSFKKDGLVEEGVSVYDPSRVKVLADDVSAVSETVVTKLKNPASAAGVAAGSLGLSLAVWQYHYTLQYIGVLGTLLIVLRKAASYDSPTEFFEEVGALVERAQVLASPLTSASAPARGSSQSAVSAASVEKDEA